MPIKAGNIILVEGMSGAGKTTAAQLLATRHGYRNFNSGTLFRATTAAMLLEHVKYDDAFDFVQSASYDFDLSDPLRPLISVGGRDVSELLQTPLVTSNTPLLGNNESVRPTLESLFDQQVASSGYVVIEGKNFGERFTHDVAGRFFLIASQGVRAYRKFAQAQEQGKTNYTLVEAQHDTFQNDQRDKQLLRMPANAMLLDTSYVTPAEVVERIIQHVNSIADI